MQITAYAMGRRVWERSKTDRRIRPIVRMGLIVATFELRIATEMARASIASVIGATIIGCVPPAIIDYHPSQFEIETDHIRPFEDFSGPVSVRSIQTASEPVALAIGASTWRAPLQRVSEDLAQRMREEFAARGVRVSPESPIELRVSLDMLTAYATGFTVKGSSQVLVQGGDRLKKRFKVESHIGRGIDNALGLGIDDALDKNLAIATITILNDPEVRYYLRTSLPAR